MQSKGAIEGVRSNCACGGAPCFVPTRSAHLKHDDGFVVEAIVRALEAGNVVKDGVGDLLGGLVAMAVDQVSQLVLPIHLALVVFGVRYSVRHEDQGVAGLGGDVKFIISNAGEQAQWKALSAHGGGFS